MEEEKRKKEAEQEGAKQLIKSSQNSNSFNAPKKENTPVDKSKPQEKKDQPDGKFISPTKFEKVNNGKGFFQNIIGAFKKLFA